jgi:hypothetical protein
MIIQLFAGRQQLYIAEGVYEEAIADEHHEQENKQSGVYFVKAPGEYFYEYIGEGLLHIIVVVPSVYHKAHHRLWGAS